VASSITLAVGARQQLTASFTDSSDNPVQVDPARVGWTLDNRAVLNFDGMYDSYAVNSFHSGTAYQYANGGSVVVIGIAANLNPVNVTANYMSLGVMYTSTAQVTVIDPPVANANIVP
jgi:hypothetical protein